MLLLGAIVACIMLSPGLASAMQKVPFCEKATSEVANITFHNAIKFDCGIAAGHLAVYRLCFVMTLFFLLMALIMIGVRNSKDPRAVVQNG